MTSRTQLLSVTVVLGAFQLISGYSFKNCIEHSSPKGRYFNCIHRNVNNISAIIADLPKSATNLTICSTAVVDIPSNSFANLSMLQFLRLDHNHLRIISEAAFQNLHQLKSLNLSFNYLSELSSSVFKDLHNLTFLSLTNNNLKLLPGGIFVSLINLETLLIRQNFLSDFSGIAESVSHLTNLTQLDLCFNSLTSLSHTNASLPKSLTILYICRNNLSTLGCRPSFLRFIKVFDLSYNARLPTAAFQGVDLGQINYLRLRSTSVKVVEFLNISNINARHVDFTGTGLNNNRLQELCKMLKNKVKQITNLHLGSNQIGFTMTSILSHCPTIKGGLDLSRNKLKKMNCMKFLEQQTKVKSFNAEHNHLTSLPTCKTKGGVRLNYLEEVSFRYNRILSVDSNAFYHMPKITTLKLNINIIAFLGREALKGLKKLNTLRLDNNLLTDLFNDTFEDNANLQTLNLRNNRISVIFNGTFRRLTKLTTLDLGGNKITHFDPSGLDGLTSLSKLYLDGNNLKEIETSISHVFQNTLTVLDLEGNQIRYLNGNIGSPFINMSKLSDLKLGWQRPYGLTILPRTLLRGLHSLKSLYLTNNNIYQLAPDTFDDLTALRFLTLDNCCVGVVDLKPGVFKNLRNLTRLTVENMGIQDISGEVFGNLTQLRKLQLNHNVMQSIRVDALRKLPKLQYLDIRNVPLACTCRNSFLQNWTQTNLKVQVVYLYNLLCPDQKQSFYNFDTKVCKTDLGKNLFFITATVIFLFTFTPLFYVKLYWKVKYSYYVFRCWFNEQWRKLREEEENCKYDAFISYNSSDEWWVMDQLLPNLEGNGSSFKLCLHHRDFEPGRYIVDNIVSAVYSSRKTICVMSKNFLQSEWCSLEIQLASYRLFDEHRDVLLLVFLEPISERQVSVYHHMRKVMLRKTYLQWPGSDCTNPGQAQDLFWNQLRRAMKTASRLEADDSDQTQDCATIESKENEHFVTSDETVYLIP
ncbi:toll-like receptor 21 [Betta splendens]|uniref:Toll-like receptor 21 n=1 Tax=Betta splendens TaxID=158456 RepID=A0A6P7KQG2_BETSP|nr:toll-like receptor 21 [Betta splendens]XP_028984711.1 toll-like receptor 21 [Betta splendens]